MQCVFADRCVTASGATASAAAAARTPTCSLPPLTPRIGHAAIESLALNNEHSGPADALALMQGVWLPAPAQFAPTCKLLRSP